MRQNRSQFFPKYRSPFRWMYFLAVQLDKPKSQWHLAQELACLPFLASQALHSSSWLSLEPCRIEPHDPIFPSFWLDAVGQM